MRKLFAIDRRVEGPFRIRVSQHLRPTQLLTLVAKRGVEIRDVSLDVMGLGSPWGGQWGDPVTERPRTLSGIESIDLVMNVAKPGQHSIYVLQDGVGRDYAEQDDIVLLIYWEAETWTNASNRFALLWTYSDRRRGRAPFLVNAKEAERLIAQPSDDSEHRPSIYSRHHRRVRRFSRYDEMSRKGAREDDRVIGIARGTARVERLTLRGLRGFKTDETLRLAVPNGSDGSGLTVVVGENNAGKSTVWEAFDSVARKMRSDVSFSEGRRNMGAGGVRICMERTDGSTYVLESRHADTSETRGEWMNVSPSGSAAFELVSVPARRQFQPSFGKSGTIARDWMVSGADFSRARQADQFTQFTGRLFDLHNDDAKKARFDDLMAEVVGHEFNWSIELADGQFGQSYYLKVKSESGSHTSDGLGDGIISLMFILNALYDSEPGTLLTIDEPELSLHPQLVRRLGRVISRLASDRQIVIFTHAPELISWDDIGAGGEVARVFRRDGESKIAQASRGAIDEVTKARGGWTNPHALGWDANAALFLDDGVVVVEGQEDAALLPRAFEQLAVPFNGSIFGWGSGGAHNVPRFLRLLRELGFSRVVAILDNDVPDLADELRKKFEHYLILEQPAADIRDKRGREVKEKLGLLDEKGRMVKEQLRDQARSVLLEASDYLGFTDGATSNPPPPVVVERDD